MRLQVAALALFAVFLVACAQDSPAFRNQPPSQAGRYSTSGETKSLYDHLLRLGFSYDLIIRKVREASAADVDEDE